MLELIKYIVEQFAEEQEAIEYKVEETEDAINVTVLLADSDMGKVIGKQGKIAKALRTLVRAATPRDSKKYNVEIQERSAE
ncbi:MAG: KH domain-containing protein [Clostridia bacterium]|nr:KH domain-containing protein [Clostridia bacterium]